MEIQEFIHSVEKLRANLLRQAKHVLHNEDDAEDAVQETLVKLWMVSDKISDATKLRNLASVICKNVSLNMLRSAKEQISIERADVISMQGNPQVQLEERENQQKLISSIKALTDKQRAILKMRNVENMSYADIAKIVGTSESSVRGMISKARMTLLKNMKGDRI